MPGINFLFWNVNRKPLEDRIRRIVRSNAVAKTMRAFYQTLSERDRRRYVAVEAQRLGHGGITYVAQVFDCSERTIERGLAELPHDNSSSRARDFPQSDPRQESPPRYHDQGSRHHRFAADVGALHGLLSGRHPVAVLAGLVRLPTFPKGGQRLVAAEQVRPQLQHLFRTRHRIRSRLFRKYPNALATIRRGQPTGSSFAGVPNSD